MDRSKLFLNQHLWMPSWPGIFQSSTFYCCFEWTEIYSHISSIFWILTLFLCFLFIWPFCYVLFIPICCSKIFVSSSSSCLSSYILSLLAGRIFFFFFCFRMFYFVCIVLFCLNIFLVFLLPVSSGLFPPSIFCFVSFLFLFQLVPVFFLCFYHFCL